jgi:penicillin-binding protein 1B
MATIVEHHYSKLEILENYLNEIYMGQHGAKGIFGMWEASRVYFGKEPRDLTLGELTILAGIVQRPNYFMPLRHPDRAVQRREYVLQRMRALGDITEEEYQAARKEKIVRRALPPDENGAPYFADFVRKQLEEHLPTGTLTTAGLRVLTSLDPRLQRLAQEAVRKAWGNLRRNIRVYDDRSPKSNSKRAWLLCSHKRARCGRWSVGAIIRFRNSTV